jgi:hypothetical protein
MTKVFPSSLHIQTPNLDTKVLLWAWSVGLFETHSELERCRIQKVNWFAGYMFPAETPERLELIMRFFLCLFLLDDLLDHLSEKESFGFLRGLMLRSAQSELPRLQALGSALILTHESLGNHCPSQQWRKEWMDTWSLYVSGLHWEVKNKSWGQMPSLEDYRFHRPSSSGVFLAIHLLRTATHPKSCEADFLEHHIARLICLSNDLASYEKELAIGDFHNELIILQDALSEKVQSWAVQEIQQIQKRIAALAKEVSLKSETCKSWVEGLLLMVGGCLAWSAETSRYVVYVNGTLRSN